MREEVQASLLLGGIYKYLGLKECMGLRRISHKWNKTFWEKIINMEENFNITAEDHWRVIKLIKVASYLQEVQLYQMQIRSTYELSRSIHSDSRNIQMTKRFGLFQVCSCNKCLGLDDCDEKTDSFSYEECLAGQFEKYTHSRENVLLDNQLLTSHLNFPIAPWSV